MATSVREFLMVVKESAYGTVMGTPVVGTDSFWVPLVESNSFDADMVPDVVETPYGGGVDAPGEAYAGTWTTAGTLQCLGYPALAKFLAAAAINRVNDVGTSPWTTTEPPGDLASLSVYHAFKYRSGTVCRRRLAGGKIASLTMSCSRQDPRLKLAVELVFQKEVGNPVDASSDPDATEFPGPDDADFPTGPFTFQHTKGNLLLAGTALASYDSVSLKVVNKLDPQPWENHYNGTCGALGRETTLDAALLLKATPNLRADMAALTKKSVSLEFDDGASSLKVSMGARAYLQKAPRDLPLGKEFQQKATWRGLWDTTNDTDLTLTVS